MSCTLLTDGIAKDCLNNIGGVVKIYITDFVNVSGLTKTGSDISAFTMASGTLFYEFSFNRNTSTFSENATVSVENGSLFYDQTVTLKLPRRESAKRDVLALLMQKELAVIVKDANGNFWYPGETKGVYVSELPSESGTAAGDFNGYTITIKGEEPTQAPEVTSGAVAAVI